MHPTYHAKVEFRAELAALRAELAELRARLPASPQAYATYRDPALSPGHHRGPDGLLRDGRGNLVLAPPPGGTYEQRHAAALAEHKAKQQAEHDAAREGLEGGLWRDPTGLVRNVAGELAIAAEINAQRAADVGAIQRAEHRNYLQRIGMPVHSVRLPVRRSSPDDLAD
jgi:hypothetical protein